MFILVLQETAECQPPTAQGFRTTIENPTQNKALLILRKPSPLLLLINDIDDRYGYTFHMPDISTYINLCVDIDGV